MRRALLAAGLIAVGLAGCERAPEVAPVDDRVLVLEPSDFSQLPGFQSDNVGEAIPAMRRSCARMLRGAEDRRIGPGGRYGTVADWRPICEVISREFSESFSEFLQRNFRVWRASDANPDNVLFTGYYEPELRGSRTRSGVYTAPLYPRPEDLVLVDLGEFRESLKGERIAGRILGGRLRPYDNRAAIEDGALIEQVRPFLWLDDPIDSFFLHIQGSGLVRLDDGSRIRVGYDGHNGHVYYAVGRYLIEAGHVPRAEMSMQAIRAWLTANPDRMDEVMNKNPSYIFFRELTGDGPIGAQGVALTPGRSIAVDRAVHAMGVPMWVDIDYRDALGNTAIRRLMVAQDTGGAIRGPVRGDFFWGSGAAAGERAGAMAAKGALWLLLPNGVDPNAGVAE
jgi:membrane-bound lytic murein transglycosylase A